MQRFIMLKQAVRIEPLGFEGLVAPKTQVVIGG
jgi:hypothetical protein